MQRCSLVAHPIHAAPRCAAATVAACTTSLPAVIGPVPPPPPAADANGHRRTGRRRAVAGLLAAGLSLWHQVPATRAEAQDGSAGVAEPADRQRPLSSLYQEDNKQEVESCTRKCVPTCIRGGEGAPGLGPISLRREIVVFKEGFRSRQYCLSECLEVCALSLKAAAAAKP